MAANPNGPLDLALRAMIGAAKPHIDMQSLAEAAGRKKAWLTKYVNGAGAATIDQCWRIVAYLNGWRPEGRTANAGEDRLLTAYRSLRGRKNDAVGMVEHMLRTQEEKDARRAELRTPRSTERNARTPSAEATRAHGIPPAEQALSHASPSEKKRHDGRQRGRR